MNPRLTLISHALCPYVQRAAIVLHEKGAAFERRSVDLAHKPDWFRAISPLGKTPVLLVDDEPIFESAVICEYLDETLGPRLHPADPLARARHRGWIEFASALLDAIAGFYNAPDRAALRVKAETMRAQFGRLERELGRSPYGRYFGGDAFSIVDAAFGPVFRYFDVFDRIGDFGILRDLAGTARWRASLRTRPSVRDAVDVDYAHKLLAFVRVRGGALSELGLAVA